MATDSIRAHAEDSDYAAVFASLVFPTSKSAILQKAGDHGGIDSEVMRTLQLVPDRTYSSDTDLRDEVQGIYLAQGLPSEQLPL